MEGGMQGWREGGSSAGGETGEEERQCFVPLLFLSFKKARSRRAEEKKKKKHHLNCSTNKAGKKSSNMQVTFQHGHRIHRGVLRCDLAVTCEPLSRCGPPGKLIGEDGNPFPFLFFFHFFFSVSNSWQHFKGMVHPKLKFRPSGSPLHS